ncbi:cysteine proteinase [Viridothelium virens]|uniref:Cysteine proteinase n=1 Tax=Viridothelium virens TaxID=1048519 RepID=A0A6A6H8T2_VIRVR|nr:cysteine proteinase [Viridothelium virens]
MEELHARHRKEQRDLQSKITQKKKSATKKTRKGVNDECASLEQELKERQAAEIGAIDTENGVVETVNNSSLGEEEQVTAADGVIHDDSTVKAEYTQITPIPSADPTQPNSDYSRKPNRQKARLARRAAEQEALADQAAKEAASMPDERERERLQMLSFFEQRGLKEHEIRADGHCLYSAIADQINQLGLSLSPSEPTNEESNTTSDDVPSYLQVRHAAANYIIANPDDFAAFLEEPLDEYIHKVRDTGEWGGQLELMALANAYGIEINVLQGNGRVEKITSQSKPGNPPVWLAYYRHGFGLGEHYNSLRKEP